MPNVETAPGTATRVALSAVLIAASVVAVQLTPAPSPRYVMVDEIAKDLPAWRGEWVRVHGWVVAGSIVRATPTRYAFTLTVKGEKLRVWYEGLLPDPFRDQAEIVVTGSLEEEADGWVFQSSVMNAKCGGTYRDAPRDRTTKFQ